MATKRMFSRDVTDSDSFLDLSLSAQALFFHLGMVADDEGMVSSAKRTGRSIGASDDALIELVQAGFLIAFPDSGVYAIRHFFVNNCIRQDRAKESIHKSELSRLQKDANGVYSLRLHDDGQMSAECPADVRRMSAKCQTNTIQDGQSDDRTDQSTSCQHIGNQSINQIKAQLTAEGWTMKDVETAIDRCRGKSVRDVLSYARKTLENMRKEKDITIPLLGQSYEQRDYQEVQDELIEQQNQHILAALAAKREEATG